MTEKEILDKWTVRSGKNNGFIKWTELSWYEELSEEFIRKYWNKVYWSCISHNQKLSDEFIIECKQHIYFDHLMFNRKVSSKIKLQMMREKGWLTKEDSSHFIQYDSFNNKLNELERLI